MTERTRTGLIPRRRGAERHREAILEAAVEVVAEQGVAALTHQAVARQAGVSHAAAIRNFASLSELHEEAVEILDAKVETRLGLFEADLSTCRDVPERLGELTHEILGDSRLVRSAMVFFGSAATDVGLRYLARRWADRLTDAIALYCGRERAIATVIYLNGCVMHTVVHDSPLDRGALDPHAIAQTVRVLWAKPPPGV